MTMPLADIMQGIEQYRFSSELNLAAGTKAFRRGLRNHNLFLQLAEAAKDKVAQESVAKRIEDLATAPFDARYENRYDAALSAYLTALADTAEPEIVAKAATAAARAINTWWTSGISRELLAHAVATGLIAVPKRSHVIPRTIVAGVDWRKAIYANLGSTDSIGNVITITGNRILEALRVAEVTAQTKSSGASDVVISPSSDEGKRFVWKARTRGRKQNRHRVARTSYVTRREGNRLSA